MTTEEKLENFYNHSIESAHNEAERLINEHQAALDQLAGACAGAGPEGLDIREFSCGETGYDRDSRLLKRPAQAVCSACLYAVAEPGGAFLDFEIRGESQQ